MSIPKNNEVHVRGAPVNVGVTKDDGLSKKSDKYSKKKVGNKKDALKAKRTPSDKFHTPTKINKTPKNK